jgi:hypothetical protein
VDTAGRERVLDRAGQPYTIGGGTLTVVGLADLGLAQDSYDDAYVEDHDIQIDIVLSGDEAAMRTIRTVEIPASDGYSPFYNPDGPGNEPDPPAGVAGRRLSAIRAERTVELPTTRLVTVGALPESADWPVRSGGWTKAQGFGRAPARLKRGTPPRRPPAPIRQ